MLNKIIKHLVNKLLYHKKVKFSFGVNIGLSSNFEGKNVINKGSIFVGYLGYGSYIGSNSDINGKIGKFTSIAGNCKTINGIHPYSYPYVSTHPMFYSLDTPNGKTFAINHTFNELKYADYDKKYSVIIGNDCWLCENAKLIAGITVGDGAIVLTNAVVTKDVPPYAIVGGIPAKIIKYRYDETTIKFLLNVKWWNKDIKWLETNAEYFNDILLFEKLFTNN